MLAFDIEEMKKNMSESLRESKHAFYGMELEFFGRRVKESWEILSAVEQTIQALWGKRPAQPKLVRPAKSLLPAIRTATGWEFMIKLPPGYRFDDLLNAESFFYTACGGRSTEMKVEGRL